MCSFGEKFSELKWPLARIGSQNYLVVFCSKTLLMALDDTEESSAVGSAIVLKNFIRLKGSELFHAVPELVQDSLLVTRNSFVFDSL